VIPLYRRPKTKDPSLTVLGYRQKVSRRIGSSYAGIYSYNASVVVGWSVFTSEKKNILKTRHVINCAVKIYSAGFLTRSRRIGS
jgi:hypothetical protein